MKLGWALCPQLTSWIVKVTSLHWRNTNNNYRRHGKAQHRLWHMHSHFGTKPLVIVLIKKARRCGWMEPTYTPPIRCKSYAQNTLGHLK